MEVRVVSNLLSELIDLQQTILDEHDALIEDGVEVVQTAVRVSENLVHVYIRDLTVLKESVFESYFPNGPYALFDGLPAVPESNNRFNSPGQWKGGIRIENESYGGVCTAGFMMKRPGTAERYALNRWPLPPWCEWI